MSHLPAIRNVFSERHRTRGYVYVSGSRNGKILKVGSTIDLEQRDISLNTSSYANQKDWVILAHNRCENSGAVESKIQNRLHSYKTMIAYDNYGKTVRSREVFRCSFLLMPFIISECLDFFGQPEDFLSYWEKPGAKILYDFRY